jgi:hypothetical protein
MKDLPLLKSQKDILGKIREIVKEDNFLEDRLELFLSYLDEESKKTLNDVLDISKYKDIEKSNKSPGQEIGGFMFYAFDKAHRQRSLSIERAIEHLSSWLWLAGEDKLAQSISNYTNHGLPQLRKICKFMEINPKEYGDQ